jgi:diguanylate cyclase (GGDEF)-like protein
MFYSPIIAERRRKRPATDPIWGAVAMRDESDAGAAHARATALARTLPRLAGLGLLGLAAMLTALAGIAAPLALGGWALAVAAINLVALRTPRRGERLFAHPAPRPLATSIAYAAIHALLWAALPLLIQPADAAARLTIVAGLATMLAGALLLAAAPRAALGWIAILAAGLVCALLPAPGLLPGGVLLLLAGYAATLAGGSLAIGRMLAAAAATALAERNTRESIAQLLKEYEDQGVGWLWQIDAANLLTYVSPRICVLLGRSTTQLVGQSLPVVLGCDPRLGDAIVARTSFGNLDVEVATPSGVRWVSLSGNPVVDATGTYRGFRGVGTDITEARRSQDRLTQLASIDVLTGLPNRQRLREIFAEAIAETARTGRPCAILFLDLDGFKPVNDTFGHSIGDAVLRIVAQRLHAEVGGLGRIGRVGGDEFALLLHDGRDRASVETLARRLIASIAEPFLFDKGEIRIGISVGCAFAPVDGLSIDDLLLKADLALYEAKSQGRGTFRLFDTQMQRDAEARVRLEQDLRRAIDNDQLRIAYQPILSATTQQVLGFEALLRWHHPERGAIPPADFIPLAEDCGLIGRIGAWVVEQACRDAACWPEPLFVSVNVSPRQLLDPGLPLAVGEALARTRLQADRLELEVTESVFMGDSDGSLDVLRRLRGLGVGIALDDFGTGYSSLGYLNKTIFHTLKIDGSFVRDAGTRSETRAIIAAIVSLANSFSMQITAEGIETADDLARMRDFGCHRLQGYLFGRPMWHEETLELLYPEEGDAAKG